MTADLALLGTRVTLAADRAELLDGVRAVYGRVRSAGPPQRTLAAELSARADDLVELRLAGDSVIGRGPSLKAAAAATAFALFHPVARAATEHFVIHSGVVESRGRVVLLVAPSRVGKTTLTLALVGRGAGFLSDECAPIARTTGEVEPFPRAVGVRPGPLAQVVAERAGDAAVRIEERGGRTKLLVDPIGVGLGPAGRGGPPAHIVFLVAGAGPAAAAAEQVRFRLELVRPSPRLGARLMRVRGVLAATSCGSPEEPAYRIVARPDAALGVAVDTVCHGLGARVVRFVEETMVEPDYSRDPEIRELGAGDGLLRLACHLENGARSALLEGELDDRPAALVWALGERLGETPRYWSLTTGRLPAMCDLVEALP